MAIRRQFTPLQIGVGVLIVTALLGIGLITFKGVQEKFRDSKRLSDMKEFSKSLELYHTSNSRYPIYPSAIEITGEDAFSQELLGELLFRRVPTDPLYPMRSYTYASDSLGTTYRIQFCMETGGFEGRFIGCSNEITP